MLSAPDAGQGLSSRVLPFSRAYRRRGGGLVSSASIMVMLGLEGSWAGNSALAPGLPDCRRFGDGLSARFALEMFPERSANRFLAYRAHVRD
jgi:hypothetical protein